MSQLWDLGSKASERPTTSPVILNKATGPCISRLGGPKPKNLSSPLMLQKSRNPLTYNEIKYFKKVAF
jgi:hypothetical protein